MNYIDRLKSLVGLSKKDTTYLNAVFPYLGNNVIWTAPTTQNFIEKGLYLNSDLYSFLYIKLFGGVNKIGKEHLMALPFPRISVSDHKKIAKLCSAAIVGSSDKALQEFIHHEIFNLTNDEVSHVQEVVNAAR